MKHFRAASIVGLLLACVVDSSVADTQKLTVAGRGGNDKAIIHSLITQVLRDDLRDAGVSIEYLSVESNYNQFLINALSSGTAPDIFYAEASMIDVLAGSGKLHVYSAPTRENAAMLPQLIDAFTVDGKFYALPKDFNAYAIVYNKDVFDDAGVPYPTDEDDTDDFYRKLERVVEVLGDEGVSGACLNPGYAGGFAPFLLATGWTPLDDEGRTLIDDRFAEAFRFYVSLFQNNIAVLTSELGHSWSGGCFGAERTAIAIEGTWIAAYLRDKAPNLRYGAVLMPANPATGSPGNLVFTVGWAINAGTADPALAERVVRILTSEVAQQWILDSGLALPSGVAMAARVLSDDSDDDQEQELSRAIYAGSQEGLVVLFSFGPYGDAWMVPVDEALSAVLVGGVLPEDALDAAQLRYDDMYAKQQAANR